MEDREEVLAVVLEYAIKHRHLLLTQGVLQQATEIKLPDIYLVISTLDKIYSMRNVDQFEVAARLIETVYVMEDRTCSFKLYSELLLGFKSKVLLECLRKNEPNFEGKLNKILPEISERSEVMSKELDEYQDSVISFRDFFISLVQDREARENYFVEEYAAEYGQECVTSLMKLLNTFIVQLISHLPQTKLEMLFSRRYKIDNCCGNKEIEKLLNFLRGILILTEEDILRYLDLLYTEESDDKTKESDDSTGETNNKNDCDADITCENKDGMKEVERDNLAMEISTSSKEYSDDFNGETLDKTSTTANDCLNIETRNEMENYDIKSKTTIKEMDMKVDDVNSKTSKESYVMKADVLDNKPARKEETTDKPCLIMNQINKTEGTNYLTDLSKCENSCCTSGRKMCTDECFKSERVESSEENFAKCNNLNLKSSHTDKKTALEGNFPKGQHTEYVPTAIVKYKQLIHLMKNMNCTRYQGRGQLPQDEMKEKRIYVWNGDIAKDIEGTASGRAMSRNELFEQQNNGNVVIKQDLAGNMESMVVNEDKTYSTGITETNEFKMENLENVVVRKDMNGNCKPIPLMVDATCACSDRIFKTSTDPELCSQSIVLNEASMLDAKIKELNQSVNENYKYDKFNKKMSDSNETEVSSMPRNENLVLNKDLTGNIMLNDSVANVSENTESNCNLDELLFIKDDLQTVYQTELEDNSFKLEMNKNGYSQINNISFVKYKKSYELRSKDMNNNKHLANHKATTVTMKRKVKSLNKNQCLKCLVTDTKTKGRGRKKNRLSKIDGSNSHVRMKLTGKEMVKKSVRSLNNNSFSYTKMKLRSKTTRNDSMELLNESTQNSKKNSKTLKDNKSHDDNKRRPQNWKRNKTHTQKDYFNSIEGDKKSGDENRTDTENFKLEPENTNAIQISPVIDRTETLMIDDEEKKQRHKEAEMNSAVKRKVDLMDDVEHEDIKSTKLSGFAECTESSTPTTVRTLSPVTPARNYDFIGSLRHDGFIGTTSDPEDDLEELSIIPPSVTDSDSSIELDDLGDEVCFKDTGLSVTSLPNLGKFTSGFQIK